MTVYLVQEPTVPRHATGKTIDISPLYQWGNVEVLIDQGQVASFNPTPVREQIARRLRDFDPDVDFICAAGGDYLGMLMAGMALADMGFDYAYFLRFERKRLPDGSRSPSEGSYVPVMFPVTIYPSS